LIGRQSPSSKSHFVFAFKFAIKGVASHAFYRWDKRDWLAMFLHAPERIQLFRLFKDYHDLTNRFMTASSIFGVADNCGIELLHPI
jgi:hypothetical protein